MPPFCFILCQIDERKTIMSTRKRITELSVAELRTQLGKRGVEATGDRPVLIARLKKVGHPCHVK